VAKFDVDVEGVTYEVDAPDERTAWRWAKATHAKAPQAPDNPTSSKNLIGAAFEPLAHLATGAVAAPVAGLAGLAASAANAAGIAVDPAAVVKGVGGAMTYQPRTTGGKNATEAITYPLQKIAEAGQHVGDKTMDLTGSPGLAAQASTVVQALPMALGLRYAPSGKAATPGLDAALQAPGRVASAVAKPVKNLVEQALPGGAERVAGRAANDLAGTRREQVIEALLAAEEIVPGSKPTAGQAATKAGAYEFSALQRLSEQRKPSEYGAIADAQEAARVAALRTIAQTPEKLAQAKADRSANANEAYGAIRDRKVDPRSDVELMEAAIRDRVASKAAALQEEGKFATFAAQNETRAQSFVPVPGMPRVAGRVTEFPQRAAEGAAAAKDAGTIRAQRFREETYLRDTMDLLKETVGLSDKSLAPLLERPSMRAAVEDAIKSARETGSYFPSKPGDKFSVENLQRIKMALDDVTKDPATFGLRATEAKEIGGTRDAFVSWLSNKVPEWRDARQQYAAESKPINQMEVGQYLEQKLRNPLDTAERGPAFAQAVRDAPSTIKKSTGQPRYNDLGEVLSPQQMSVVDALSRDLQRNSAYAQQARDGMVAAKEKLGITVNPEKPMGFTSQAANVVKALLDRAQGKAGEKALNIIAERMQDPGAMAELMNAATPKQRQQIVELLAARNRTATTAGVGGAQFQEAQ
jgi:hypothetical protein